MKVILHSYDADKSGSECIFPCLRVPEFCSCSSKHTFSVIALRYHSGLIKLAGIYIRYIKGPEKLACLRVLCLLLLS